MNTSNKSASSASNTIQTMRGLLGLFLGAAILGTLGGCAGRGAPATGVNLPVPAPALPLPVRTQAVPDRPLPAPLQQPASRWVPVSWSDLPGLEDDIAHPSWHSAWMAWLHSCTRASPVWAALCAELRPLSLASPAEQRDWMLQNLQPYRVESSAGTSTSTGLLTAYYEPVLTASRMRSEGFGVPLYRRPPGLRAGTPWYSRQEIDTLEPPQAALRGQALAWLADPLDALLLQIQGSGQLQITEPDGRQRRVRLSYAGSNEQPYRSVGRWLLEQGELTEASWPAIKAWAARHPQQLQALLWSNPRVVFFREEALPDTGAPEGPRGAQGVPLTPGRSIAVDRDSIPHGTPVWLASQGPLLRLQKLTLAQDSGAAITGAVRADYFLGSDSSAVDLAGRIKQPLQLWALWPRAAASAPTSP